MGQGEIGLGDKSDRPNNHSHFLIWLCLVGLMCGWRTCDCSDQSKRMEALNNLEKRVERLEHPDAAANRE